MPRRASSTVQPRFIIGAIVLVAALMAGGWALFSKINDPYRTLAPLDVATYLESANSLRGNVYKLSGTVGTQLAWAPMEGRLYSVEVGDSKDILPLMIPAAFNSVNMQKGQRYYFKIEVADKGVLRVQDIRKA